MECSVLICAVLCSHNVVLNCASKEHTNAKRKELNCTISKMHMELLNRILQEEIYIQYIIKLYNERKEKESKKKEGKDARNNYN
jgi:hypothetical protein